MNYIIDRIEEGTAICEDEHKNMISIAAGLLPGGLKEGDVIREEKGQFLPDPEASARRRQAMKRKLTDLFE